MACTGCTPSVWGGDLTPLFADDFESYAGDGTAFAAVWTGSGFNPLSTTHVQGGAWAIGTGTRGLWAQAIAPASRVLVFAIPIYLVSTYVDFDSQGLLNVHQGATHDGFNSHCSLRLLGDGTLSVRRTSTSVVLESAASGLVLDQWNCITGVLDVADAGAWRIYVNGVQVLEGTGDLSIGGAIGGVSISAGAGAWLDNVWIGTMPTFGEAVHCPTIVGSAVFGVKTTVAATRAISLGLDDDTHVDTAEGTFTVHGATDFDGDVVIEGDTRVQGDLEVEGDTVLDGDVTVLGTLTAPGVPGAPLDAHYVTLSPDTELTAERVLTAGTGITITDGGSTVTIAATGGGGGGSDHYDCPLSDGDLTAAELIFASGECVIVQVPL